MPRKQRENGTWNNIMRFYTNKQQTNKQTNKQTTREADKPRREALQEQREKEARELMERKKREDKG